MLPTGVLLVHYLDDFLLAGVGERAEDALVMEGFLVRRKSALRPVCLLSLLGKSLDLVGRAGARHGPTMLQLRLTLLRLAVGGGGWYVFR